VPTTSNRTRKSAARRSRRTCSHWTTTSRRSIYSPACRFKAPTASCILAALDPERHAVVDTRVWASLDRHGYLDGRKESFDADDYVTMMAPIRDIAADTGYSAAEVGYALFAYDVEQREGTLH